MNESLEGSFPPLTGGCLCGAVRYQATPDHRDGDCCHCRMCQLGFGNTRAAFFSLRKTEVSWLKQPPTYRVSSKIARRGFCATCGSPLSFEYLDSARMDLTVGSLDEPGALKPVSHFAAESCVAAWHAADGLPDERIDDGYGDGAVPGIDTARRS